MKKKFEIPKVETKSQAELDEIIALISNTKWSDATKDFLINCIRLACWFPTLLERQHITMRKLREMIFGKRSKRKKSGNSDEGNSSSGDSCDDGSNSPSDTNNTVETNPSTDDKEPDNGCVYK